MKTNIYVLLFLFSLISCKKIDSGVGLTLPIKTQTGQNTFGFLLDSNVWINRGTICSLFPGGSCSGNLKGEYYSTYGEIHIAADQIFYKNDSLNTIENFDIFLTNFNAPRIYNTLLNDSIIVLYKYSKPGKTSIRYFLSKTNPSFSITITKLDSLNKVVSGEFSGKLFKILNDTSFITSTTDSILLKDGRFDIKME